MKTPALFISNLYALYLVAWTKVILHLYSHANKTWMIGSHSTKRRQIIRLVYMLWWKLNTQGFSRFNVNVMPSKTSRSGFST